MRVLTVIPILMLTLLQHEVFGQSRERVIGDIRRSGIAEGSLKKLPNGTVVLESEKNPTVSIPVERSETLNDFAFGVPVTGRIVIRDNQVRLSADRLDLGSVGQFQLGLAPRLKPMTLEALESSFRNAQARAAVAMRTPVPAEADLLQLDQALAAAENEIVKAYVDLPVTGQDAQRTFLAGNFVKVRRDRKAVYGRLDFYRPLTYGRILANSRGTVAIAQDRAHCSGVLVSKDLVLTALHCIKDFFVQDLKVWFNFEQDLSDNNLPRQSFDVAGVVAEGKPVRGGEKLDFALLRILPHDGKYAGELYPAQCISMKRPLRDAPLYVVGHPHGLPRSVHDNGWVIFPFQINEHQFAELELLVQAEVANNPDRQNKLQTFRESYVRRNDPVVGIVYENYSVRWNKQPTIGAEIDTFHGNSGGPAFDKRNHRIVGLLFDGEDDVSTPWSPGWTRHEAILPITKVVEQLNNDQPDWMVREKVCVWNSATELASPALGGFCNAACTQ